VALLRAVADAELDDATAVAGRLRGKLRSAGAREVAAELERQRGTDTVERVD
jgi:tritrans,polycis-undecaprenyl-diphosphate synthase [geranylgeranyl-diphosphate specific]